MTTHQTASSRTLSVSIDVGGTFTDVVLVDRQTGDSWNAKTPTTPPNFEQGFMQGIQDALALAGRSASDLTQVFHATTVATNAILEMRGARAALLTTRGFRHVLEIGRHDIPRKANLYSWVKPKRAVAARHIHEISQRGDALGRELLPLDESNVLAAAAAIKAQGIRAVAICFLHSYANPAHERRARQLVLQVVPDAMVSISSEVLPVFREYERTTATILNVYVMPLVANYVARLGAEMKAAGIDAHLLLMKSNGGVASAATIEREPIQTALSGPAAGVVGAVHEASLVGCRNVITVDVGGTSADICVIQDGQPGVTTKGQIGPWPMTLPMVDIHTIGAGGGSIARITAGGALVVGPESAGAMPGPLCYGRGGIDPTVTDARLVLGHLPGSLLAGAMQIDRAAAERGIEEKIAKPLGLDLFEAAAGIINVMNNNMLAAIRLVSIERGLDPRDFVLLPFGGAGPLHGGELARLLGIPTILVPPSPGVLSAQGLTVSSLRYEFSRTCLLDLASFDPGLVASLFDEMQSEAERWLDSEQVQEADRQIEWEASLRYRHQGFELHVPWPERAVSQLAVARLSPAFHALHKQLYSFALEDTPIELVGLRVTAVGRLPPPRRVPLAPDPTRGSALIGQQLIYFNGRFVDAPIYARSALSPNQVIGGPAIVQQLDATILLGPGEVATVHPYGALLITVTT